MNKDMRLGLIGVSDGRELGAALAAGGVTVVGFWGEDTDTLSALADYHGLAAAADWRELLAADALCLGAGLSAPASLITEVAAAAKPLLLMPALVAASGAIDWLTTLAAGSTPVGLALDAVVDDGLAYCRQLVRGGVLGRLMGVEVRVASAESEAAWELLAAQLGAALWVTGLQPASLAAIQTTVAGAAYVSALCETSAGVPLTISLRAATPGGAHDDLQAPRLLGDRGQLALAPEPLIWQTSASESNRSQRWENLVYAGQRGSLARGISAFCAAVQAHEPPPLPLAEALVLARLVAALRGATATGAWRAL